jgi:hypothetical protein
LYYFSSKLRLNSEMGEGKGSKGREAGDEKGRDKICGNQSM